MVAEPITVAVTLSVVDVDTSLLVTEAVLVMIVRLVSEVLTVTAKVTVTSELAVTVRPLAIMGGVPVIPPAEGGTMATLSVTKLVLAASESEMTTPVALVMPLLLTTIV